MLNESSSFRLTQPGAGFKYRATLKVFLVEMIFRSASVLELLCLFSAAARRSVGRIQGELSIHRRC
jgi:hypothetical protein